MIADLQGRLLIEEGLTARKGATVPDKSSKGLKVATILSLETPQIKLSVLRSKKVILAGCNPANVALFVLRLLRSLVAHSLLARCSLSAPLLRHLTPLMHPLKWPLLLFRGNGHSRFPCVCIAYMS